MRAPLHIRRNAAGLTLRWARRLAGLVAGVVAAALAGCFVAVGVLMASGHRPLIERSDSMAPIMHAGDVLLVKQVTARDARVGDVITFADPEHHDQTLTHRVISVTPDRRSGELAFITKGDANTGVERWRAPRQAGIGRYVAGVPKAGYVLEASRRWPWRGFVVLAALVMAADVLRRLWRATPSTPVPASVPTRP